MRRLQGGGLPGAALCHQGFATSRAAGALARTGDAVAPSHHFSSSSSSRGTLARSRVVGRRSLPFLPLSHRFLTSSSVRLPISSFGSTRLRCCLSTAVDAQQLQHTDARPHHAAGPLHAYERLVQEKKVNDDPSQRRALQHLQHLHDQLLAERKEHHAQQHPDAHVPHHPPRQFREPEAAPWWKLASWFGVGDNTESSSHIDTAKGVYMYGDVGCGKTFLMDLFYEGAPVPRKRRVHFNAFMLEVHSKIHKWREGKRRALEQKLEAEKEGPDLPNFNLGVSAALDADEWGDPIPPLAKEYANHAPLLCFDEFQVTDVADAMILHRLFSLMFEHGLTVVVTSNRPPDDLYKGGLQRDRFLPFIDLIKRRCLVHDFESGRDYRLRGNQNINIYQVEQTGVDVANNLEKLFTELTHHTPAKSMTVKVGGRSLLVPRAARNVAFFTFPELCKQALGAGDYIALSKEFHTVFVSGIPKMSDKNREEAKRFITLIDELYNHKVKLICSAAAEPRKLFAGGVDKREWFDEATGKHMGTIWQGEEERFMFNRAVSRLIEMQSDEYLQSPHKKDV